MSKRNFISWLLVALVAAGSMLRGATTEAQTPGWTAQVVTLSSPVTSHPVDIPSDTGAIKISGFYRFHNLSSGAQWHEPCIRFNGSASGYRSIRMEIDSPPAFYPPHSNCGSIASDTYLPSSHVFSAQGHLAPGDKRFIRSESTSEEFQGNLDITVDDLAFWWDNTSDVITNIEFTTVYGSLFTGEFLVETMPTTFVSTTTPTPTPTPTFTPTPTPTPMASSTVVSVAAAEDDAHECGQSADPFADWTAADRGATWDCWGILIFRNVPAGSEYRIQYEAGLSGSNSPNLDIHASCDASPVQTVQGNVKGRGLTTNSVPYAGSNLSGTQQTPDLSTLMVCGSEVAFVLVPSGGDFNMPAFDQGRPPELVVR